MAKKSLQKQNGFFIEGKRASLLRIAESAGGETWKNYLETHRNVRKSGDRYLESKLGKYLNVEEIRSLSGIKLSGIAKLRKGGILKSEQLNGSWYYSAASVLSAVKAGKL
jgi:hypothetical protein